MHLLEAVATIKDPGRLYRPMSCDQCGDIRIHSVDLVGTALYKGATAIWVETRCTGLEAIDHSRARQWLRLPKGCHHEDQRCLSYNNWRSCVEGDYF